ncbi:MAG: hypothetical protein J6V41_06635 [Kiritimatiellae bacterium]|nr:hypothetical protein [Kiritimatiellia bacterium]
MKSGKGEWFLLFVVGISLATLSRSFIFQLVCGNFLVGLIFVSALFMPQFIEWLWQILLRRADILISCDPLKPSASEICQNIRGVLRRIYSEGGRYLIYISPMPNTGMRIAFNLSKQSIEAKCGSELYSLDESKYQLPPFRFDNSPVVYHLSGMQDEPVDGVYLVATVKRGEQIKLSKLKVWTHALIFAEILILILSVFLDVWQVIFGAILLRRTHFFEKYDILRVIIMCFSIIIALWRMCHFYW